MALFAFGGLWLDDQFGTKPLLTIVMVLLGLVGGTLHLIRVLAPKAWPFGKRPGSNDPDSAPSRSQRPANQKTDDSEPDSDAGTGSP